MTELPSRGGRRRLGALAAAVVAAGAFGPVAKFSIAHADEPIADRAPDTPPPADEPGASDPGVAATADVSTPAPGANPDEDRRRLPRWPNGRWFVDGGMIPFFYVPGVVAVAVTLSVSAPETPRLFSSSEGGEEPKSSTIPTYQVGVLAGALTLTAGLFDRDARWYHVKGMAQSIVTTATVTQIAKLTFGRHRPSWNPSSTDDDDRMSFFSGHSSLTLTSTVYLGIYLRQHVFAPWRGDRVLAWWEIPAYAGLAALSVYVPYTRIDDNKHHVSDVLTGAAVGTGFALLFYHYQEGRYRDALGDLAITPWSDGTGVSVSGTF